jgi:hypothetical protein
MNKYRYKNTTDLAWQENKEAVTLLCKQVHNIVLNEALHELDEEFTAALNQGEILNVTFDRKQVESLFVKIAQEQFGNGKTDKRKRG